MFRRVIGWLPLVLALGWVAAAVSADRTALNSFAVLGIAHAQAAAGFSGSPADDRKGPHFQQSVAANPPATSRPMRPPQPAASVVRELAESGTNSKTPGRPTVAEVESLLKRPWLRPREVPLLGAEIEAQLTERYLRATNVSAKFAILQLLAHGGSSNCIPLFTGAIYGGFRGRHVTGVEHAKLLYIPMLLGYLAHREPAALGALHAMARPGAVTADQLWVPDGLRPPTNGVLARAFQGLGASGRPEVKEWLEQCLKLPPASADAIPGMASAAHELWLVETYGFDASVGDFNNEGDNLVPSVRAWWSTPRGKAWKEWKAAVRQARRTPTK